MIAVADVEKTSLWYQHVLGAASGHGGARGPRQQYSDECHGT